jgi:GntR family transcriptional regulator/MocR family aminotransferase
MAKRSTTLSLPLPPRDPAVPAYLWLCAALRSEILEGRLRPGARLPATRDLAAGCGLARGTVVSAFEELKSEGYLQGTVGSGTFVNEVLPDALLEVARRPPSGAPPRPGAAAERKARRRLSGFGRRVEHLSGHEPGPARAFRTDQPALDLFPTHLWARIAARRMRRAGQSLLVGCEAMGHPPLREAIATHLRTSRGVRCEAGQVAVVSGVQEALALAARLTLDPGDAVCLEDPGYSGAAQVFEAFGARIVAQPLDAEGMRVPGPRLRSVRLAHLTPAHQAPLGLTMSLPRRLELLEWARKTGALLFEDDYDSEYRYSGRPVPALQGLDRHGVVVYAGSFSKVLFPSLRLGLLVVPPALVEPLAAAISVTSRHAPLLEQAVLHEFIADGHFERHLRRMRQVYAGRSAALVEAARSQMAGLLQLPEFEAGLQTPAWLGPGLDGAEVSRAAAERRLEVASLHRYWRRTPEREGLLLGFAAVDEREIRRGARELAEVLESLARKSRRGRRGAPERAERPAGA